MIKNFKEQLCEWRHYLHQHPETAFEEKNTAAYLAENLRAMGMEVTEHIGGTGVVGTLKVGDGKGVIGIRSDIDALNLKELGKHPYTSQNEGKMHGCGHDGHMTVVLGAAKLLSERKNFNGTVRFVFQPAEEPGKGSAAMLKDGLLEKFPMDEIYGMHNMPGMPKGSISTRVGGIMGSEDNFVIHITGEGSHAARPHTGKDPLVMGAEVVMALQTIVSRNVPPNEPAVISCTEFLTDGIHNGIPTNVVIKGDTRSYNPAVQALLENRMRAISEGICQMNDAQCEFQYTHEFSPTVNAAQCVKYAVQAATNIVGEDKVDGNTKPVMISEDFAGFLEKIPGCFVFLGGGTKEDGSGTPLHNSTFDFNDDVLQTGAEYFAELIRIRLPQ